MPMTNQDIINTLNGLIQTNRDGENGYREAAEAVDNAMLEPVFSQMAQQRANFTAELINYVRELGGDPDDTSSLLGTLHRGWMELKSALGQNDADAIVEEVERGERVALTNYEEALKLDLPENIESVVRNQHNDILRAYERISTMREETQ